MNPSRCMSVSSVENLAIPKRQKVFDKTFLPAGEALPVWHTVPLDHKLPVPPSPRGSYTLYTNKVGESKYISHQRYDFDLTNPNGRQAPGPYDSLTDPSLKDYFNSPRTRQHLVNSGLVTDRGEIKCNIKEFNEYREFVRYRSVTELSLQKKKEKRVKQESVDRLFIEWPRVHRHTRGRGKIRLTQSEPPKEYRREGLDMYREDLALALRKREELTRRREEEKYSRSASRKSHKASSNRSPRMPSPDKTPRLVLDKASPRHSPEKTPRGRVLSPDKDSLNTASQIFSPRGTTLIDEIRKREQELNKRLEEQRKQRNEEHRRKVEENWRERQYRQEQLLMHEAELEARAREERQQHIMERERTLHVQRKRQEDKLKKIKQELNRNYKYGGKGDKNGQNHKGDNSISPSDSKGDNYTPISKSESTPRKNTSSQQEAESPTEH
ncbi:fibrous sheath-interacting protein 2 [Plakobranchus ocellatus]|uniref:Fibrous sheath-interacting protein 2 n=1 Tax=Plakobranchus ocellatus TaxID=259542 RepID=A0AAV4AYA5_9GAST|nr:fibrous sheath-interacting protein 2 [Plakobranchus ocellatus]